VINFGHLSIRTYLAIGIMLTGVALLWWFVVTRKKSRSFAKLLPRLYELRAMSTDPNHPDAYFQDFEQTLTKSRSALSQFRQLEADLAVLDSAAWDDLRARAAKHLITQTRAKDRGWQALFDALNEAKAYGYLRETGCTDIRFIPRATAKTPDLEAKLGDKRVLCEVKTFNASDEQAERDRLAAQGHIEAYSVANRLDDAFLTGKFSNTLVHAVAQLDREDPGRTAERVVFVVFRQDDWVGDYLPEFLAQIDEHLLRHPVTGARLVFWVRNLFDRPLSMTAAVVRTS
jgi:hypothetical protein